jgi:hypothetical protein
LALCRTVESNEREQVEARDVLAASVLVGYFKAHARRVFAEVHGADSTYSLAAALSEFLKEHDGKWEGSATELFGALSDRHIEGLPGNPDNLAMKVLAIARRSNAVRAERGWRSNSRVLRLQLLNNGVGSVGGVGEEVPVTNTTNTANTDSEDSTKTTATITREPTRTGPLSISERWEEV